MSVIPVEPRRRRGSWRPRVVAAVLGVACLVGAIWFGEGVFGGRGSNVARHLPVPDRASLEAAIVLASAATVKVEGSACGLGTAGSGVVVADGLVLTAAHVVAGADESRVVDSRGVHRAVPVLVDPLADLAVLYSPDLDDLPIPLSTAAAGRGTPAVVLGYPRGGDLDATPAVILDNYRAEQHDIYGRDRIERQILEVQANVVPGSSGGPVVNAHGELIGIVFGQSEDDSNIGFAVEAATIGEAVDAGLRATEHGSVAVSTGECLAPTTSS